MHLNHPMFSRAVVVSLGATQTHYVRYIKPKQMLTFHTKTLIITLISPTLHAVVASFRCDTHALRALH
jgi:hypothetical protein